MNTSTGQGRHRTAYISLTSFISFISFTMMNIDGVGGNHNDLHAALLIGNGGSTKINAMDEDHAIAIGVSSSSLSSSSSSSSVSSSVSVSRRFRQYSFIVGCLIGILVQLSQCVLHVLWSPRIPHQWTPYEVIATAIVWTVSVLLLSLLTYESLRSILLICTHDRPTQNDGLQLHTTQESESIPMGIHDPTTFHRADDNVWTRGFGREYLCGFSWSSLVSLVMLYAVLGRIGWTPAVIVVAFAIMTMHRRLRNDEP